MTDGERFLVFADVWGGLAILSLLALLMTDEQVPMAKISRSARSELSQESIHSWLLTEVPVGSSIEHLYSIAGQRNWRVNGSWEGNRPESHSDWGGIDGATVVWIYLGGYRSVFPADVDSFWAFDEEGRLVDVKVRKMVDAL